MNNNKIIYQNIYERSNMKTLQKIALALTIIGAINWGLIGLFKFNLVETLFGINTMLTRIIYSIVGICGLINIGIYFYEFEP